MRVNINKHESGPAYSANMLGASFNCLEDNGMLLIGDTGKNLRSHLKENATLRKLIPIREGRSIGDQARLSTKVINIAYVDSGKVGESSGWNSLKRQTEALGSIVPNTGDEASETVIFPAQKPHLKTC